MELKYYVNYYIGCPCIFYMADDDPAGYHMTLDYDTVKNWLANQDETDIKLILRRLEDITEEEAIAVHREATKTPFLPADKDEYDVTYIKSKGDVCAIQVVDLRMPKMYTNINTEGDVLIYVHETNEEPKICERVANQHRITHYLLRQHFDLFGLITAGLAIDAKTITP